MLFSGDRGKNLVERRVHLGGGGVKSAIWLPQGQLWAFSKGQPLSPSVKHHIYQILTQRSSGAS